MSSVREIAGECERLIYIANCLHDDRLDIYYAVKQLKTSVVSMRESIESSEYNEENTAKNKIDCEQLAIYLESILAEYNEDLYLRAYKRKRTSQLCHYIENFINKESVGGFKNRKIISDLLPFYASVIRLQKKSKMLIFEFSNDEQKLISVLQDYMDYYNT